MLTYAIDLATRAGVGHGICRGQHTVGAPQASGLILITLLYEPRRRKINNISRLSRKCIKCI